MSPDDAIRSAIATSTRAARTRRTRPVPTALITAVTAAPRGCPDCAAGIVRGVECASCDGTGVQLQGA